MNQHFAKGDIVNVNLGSPPSEVKGHEQAFQRPCIIIKSFDNLSLAVVIPLTTKEARFSLYTVVKILKGNGGLTADSYALCHQIRTVSFDRITGKRQKLNDRDILKIHAVLIDSLEL